MPIDQEVAVARVLVLADPPGDERRVPERGEAPGEIRADRRQGFSRSALARVGVERRTACCSKEILKPRASMSGRPYISSPKSIQAGRAGGANRRSPAGGPKYRNSCRVVKIRSPRESGNSFGSHGPHANTNVAPSIVSPDRVVTASSRRRPIRGGSIAVVGVLGTFPNRFAHDNADGTPRHQDAALRARRHGPAHLFDRLRAGPFHRSGRLDCNRSAATAPRSARVTDVREEPPPVRASRA